VTQPHLNPTRPRVPRVPRLLHDALLVAAEQDPNGEAIVDPHERVDYETFLARALHIARALQARGVRRGDRVALLAGNAASTVISLYGILLAGAVLVLLHPHTRPDKLRFTLRDCGACAVLTDPHGATLLSPLRSDLPDLHTVLTLTPPDPGLSNTETPLPSDAIALDDAASDAPSPANGSPIPLDLAALIYTSGSTGTPKGVMLTHQAMTFTQGSLTEYLRLDGSDRILSALPLAFDYGLYQAFMATHLGATLILEPSFGFPAHLVERMREEEATVLPGVPTSFASLLSLHRSAPFTLPTVRRLTNTAAHLPDAHVTRLHEVFPSALIYRMYGLTECKRVAYLEPELALSKANSVGKAIPGTETFVLDENGHPTPPGTPGILHVRGPHVMLGYWNRPEETARMLVPGPHPGERMLNTQDVFTTDEDGYLYFVGRTDDIIKRGGEKIAPREVENALHAIPGVREAAVIGMPDPLLGEAVRAYLTLDGNTDLTPRTIKRHLTAYLEPDRIPRDVIIVDDLPRTDTGKVRKRDLRDAAHTDMTPELVTPPTRPTAAVPPMGGKDA